MRTVADVLNAIDHMGYVGGFALIGKQPVKDAAHHLRAQQGEIGRLRAIIRVNGLRNGATDTEINLVLDGAPPTNPT